MKIENTTTVKIREDVYLKAKEAASYLKVSPSTLARWRHEGRGPTYIRFDTGAIVYSLRSIERFIEGCIVRSKGSLDWV